MVPRSLSSPLLDLVSHGHKLKAVVFANEPRNG